MRNFTIIVMVALIALFAVGCDMAGIGVGPDLTPVTVESVVAEAKVFGIDGETANVDYTVFYSDYTSEVKTYTLDVMSIKVNANFTVNEDGDDYNLITYIEDGRLIGTWVDSDSKNVIFTTSGYTLGDGNTGTWTTEGADNGYIDLTTTDGFNFHIPYTIAGTVLTLNGTEYNKVEL